MINCENELCIYNRKFKCVLEYIDVTAAGMCESCIEPDFPKEFVERFKQEVLDAYEQMHLSWEEKD